MNADIVGALKGAAIMVLVGFVLVAVASAACGVVIGRNWERLPGVTVTWPDGGSP